MSSNPPRTAPNPLSLAKAGPTTSTSRAAATSHAFQKPLRSQLRLHPRKTTAGIERADAATEKNTIALIRRVLCPETNSYGSATQQPLHELLPPLTSSNEVDLQLYALIAIIIKEFVYSWYAKITPDHTFVDEVLQLIAHCTRALEERLRRADVEQLVLDEIPRLVDAHIVAYRTAKRGSDLIPLPSSTREIYHTLNPHPGLSPAPSLLDPKASSEQHENEVAYRHLLAQGTLAVLLPTEDLENACLRTLVDDILADLILGNEVSGKVCENWFVWGTISKIISLASHRRGTDNEKREEEEGEQTRLEKFGLLSTKEDQYEDDSPRNSQSRVSLWMWKLVYAFYLTYVILRFVVTGLFHAALSVPEVPARDLVSSPDHPTPISRSNEAPSLPGKIATRRAVLDYRVSGTLARLIDLPRRMPWLDGCLSLIHYLIVTGPGRLGDADGVLDRFLRQTIQSRVLTPTLLPTLLLAVRTSLFPMNARPPPASSNPDPASPGSRLSSRYNNNNNSSSSGNNEQVSVVEKGSGSGFGLVDADTAKSSGSVSPLAETAQERQRPSEAEIAAIKRQCAADILSLIPRRIARAFFCITAEDIAAETNRHLESQTKRGADPEPALLSSTTRNDDDVEESLLLSAIEDDILDPFADEYCNKHLVFSIIETVLVRLLPELSERGITELMEERGVLFAP